MINIFSRTTPCPPMQCNAHCPPPASSKKSIYLAILSVIGLTLSTCGQSYESDFLTAYDAFKRKDYDTLYQLEQTMRGDTLGMYPLYFRLYLDLATLSPQQVQSFVSQYKNSAAAEKLAADYVEAKVRQGDYSNARAVANLVQNPDDDESCAIAVANAATGDTALLKTLQSTVWYNPKNSDLCTIAANQMSNVLQSTQTARLHHLWALLESDQLTAAVGEAARMGVNLDYNTLLDAKRDPSAYLQSYDLSSIAAQSAYIVALSKLADSNVYIAQNRLESSANLPSLLKAYGYRVLALKRIDQNVAEGFDGAVVKWFDQSLALPFSDNEAEQYAKHAIRFSQWVSVLKAIDLMSSKQKEDITWQYWFARASEQTNSQRAKEIAKQFYQAIAQTDDEYYGLLARDRLGIALNNKQYQITTKDRNKLSRDGSFTRAFLLKQMDADKAFYNREWNWGVKQAIWNQDDALLLAAAEQANRMEWYDRAIYAADRASTLKNDALRFPTPYLNQVLSASSEFGSDAAWVYGLMRQESRFATAARSHVGASGLMQIMPATASWIGRQLGESASGMTFDKNIRFGTFYINHVYNQLSGQPVLATAGYNGGPSRAKRWQPDYTSLAADQYIESIPFAETRQYVKNVMSNATYYNRLIGGKQYTITQRMGSIPVKSQSGIVGP